MADRIIDPSTFSIPALALELEGHSTRFALASNVYGSSMEFLVRVLTPPMPMGRFQQEDIYRFMRTGGRSNTGAAAAAAVIAREMGAPTSDIPFSFQGRILGEPGRPSPHSFLPDPCSIDSAQNKLKAAQLITLHTNFRSPAGYTGPVPRMGDIVKISLEPGSQGPFSLQKAFFKTLERKKDVTQDAQDSQESCNSLQGLSWGEAGPGAGNAARSHYTAALDAFYTRLRASDSFSTFKDNFLKGLAANAQHESALVANANGDGRPRVAGTPAIQVGAKDFCSFGYWQLNVCTSTGAGLAFAQFFAVRADTMAEKAHLKSLITNEANQFRFMGNHMRTLFPTSQTGQSGNKTANQWAQEIAIRFERCSWCKRAPATGLKTVGSTTRREDHETISRGLTADDLEASLSPAS